MKRFIAITAAIAVLGLTGAAFAAGSVPYCCKRAQDNASFHDYSMDRTAR